jgi:kynureninase
MYALHTDHLAALDAADPLAPLRDLFDLPADVIYLDGNSLGPLPRGTADRVAQAVRSEWGHGLIRSWNSAGWFALPSRLGDTIAPLIGAGPGQVLACDTTSINLYKVLSAFIGQRGAGRTRVVSERSNFPTDLYIAQGLCQQHGLTLHLVEHADDIPAALGPDVAVMMLTHVNYRDGRMHDMAALSAAAHAAGAFAIWDLAHSAGAVPVDLLGAGADAAVGCGYKYLNGGPGAPAFVWVHPQHLGPNTALQQPLQGWWGHAAPFAFVPHYQPGAGIERFQCGTQPVLALAALEQGLATVHAAQPLGGMAALRAKSLGLTDAFIAAVQPVCAAHGLHVATPLAHAQRGSQVSLGWAASAQPKPGAGYAVVQALIARGVIGDFRRGDERMPDILRFGFAPLYLRFVDVAQAAQALADVLHTRQWDQPQFLQQGAVT